MAASSSQLPPAEDPLARVTELLRLLIEQAVLTNERIARSLGLNVVDLQTFGTISRQDAPLTPSEITARTGLPASTTTRVLDRLEHAGFIKRGTDPTDRRKITVAAVEEKAAEVATHYTPMIEMIHALNAERTDRDLRAVISYLTDLTAAD
ncbi:MAG TPA: MarR family winged helix-turn-helix transcriptional regulator [Pseudonocardiaceae bacterium]